MVPYYILISRIPHYKIRHYTLQGLLIQKCLECLSFFYSLQLLCLQGDIVEILPAERNALEKGELSCKEPSTCSLSSMEKNELIHM